MDNPGKINLNAAKYNDFYHVFELGWDISNSNFKGEIRDAQDNLITSFVITKSNSDIILTIDRSILNTLKVTTYNYDVKENNHRIIEGNFILRKGITK